MLRGMEIHQGRPEDLKGKPDVSMMADFLVNGRTSVGLREEIGNAVKEAK